ncbi:hypothetical protein [Desulfoluna sp.]|uniref:hypothetical protein n=1 Tax=Desulfoluna sp. TaxID=2045199 RepID=UPI0026181B0C|nr:hypothetical protein [Desulfoluna sp.]
MIFTDTLEMELMLFIGTQAFKVPGGHIKSLKVRLQPFGFVAEAGFWVSSEVAEDTLFPEFITQDLIKVELSFQAHLRPDDAEETPVKLEGLVTGKALLEELTISNVDLAGDPVLYRRYRIDFADTGRVLWSQHFPCDLVVDGTVKELIEANRAGVELSCDWERMNRRFSVNTLPGYAHGKGASFYDFILWCADAQNGALVYDYKENSYALLGEKNTEGEPFELDEEWIKELSVEFPETSRTNDRLLNSFSENAQTRETAHKQAADGLYQDTTMSLAITSDFEDVFSVASLKPKSRGYEVRLVHSRFPCVAWVPGCFVKLREAVWNVHILSHKNEYRMRDTVIEASAVSDHPDSDRHLLFARYKIEMRSTLELKEEKAFLLPEYRHPSFPVYVEGRVVSEQGKEEEKTYQVYEHPETALDCYRVEIPIFEGREVVVPYEPFFAPGHFYFPAFKGQRVLVALEFHVARIARFLDVRPGGRLPMESQGNHLLLGKTTDDCTSISHVYVDGKPQLNIKRTSGSDTEIIHVQEGTIILETKEE